MLTSIASPVAHAAGLGTRVPGERTRMLGLATALPPNVVDQSDAAAYAKRIYGKNLPGFDALARVFDSTGIDRRHTAEPLDWYGAERSWSERTEAYVRTADALFAEVVTNVLRETALQASAIDVVVFVSSTGIATPTIDARMMPGLGFRSDVQRLPVFGLGCAGGVSGLAIASRAARGAPGTNVLLVTLELCSLAFRPDRPTKKDLIATALFGDGAAAVILRHDDDAPESAGAAPEIGRATEHLWPATLDIMGWSTDEIGLGVVLSRSLPTFIARNFRAEYDRALARIDLTESEVDRVVCHPGATRVLESIESAMDLPARSLSVERSIMRDYGNMSSPTVLFVLQRTIAEGFAGRAILTALGPGFTASFCEVVVPHAVHA